MATQSGEFPETIKPSAADAQLAQLSVEKVARVLADEPERALRIQIESAPRGESIEIPHAAFRMLHDILSEMAQGNAISLVPTHAEVSIREAADLLNVSPAYMMELLEQQTIPCRGDELDRRILVRDLLQYKLAVDQKRLAVLNELTSQAQELGLGY